MKNLRPLLRSRRETPQSLIGMCNLAIEKEGIYKRHAIREREVTQPSYGLMRPVRNCS